MTAEVSRPAWQALFEKAIAAHRAGRLDLAEDLYTEAADASSDPAVERMLAVVLAERGKTAEAITRGQSAVRRDPASAHSRAALGRVLLLANALTEAGDSFRQAVAFDPGLPAAHFGLGHALLATGDVAGACDAFTGGLGLTPDDARIHAALATSLVRCGDITRATDAARRFPAVGAVRHALGQLLFGQGRFADAAEALAQAAALLPGNAAVRHDWGAALQEAGRLIDAARAYGEAVRLDPKRIPSWHNLGSCFQALGDWAAALGCFGRAYALDAAAFPRIAQELAAGRFGRVWLRADDLRNVLRESAAGDPPASMAQYFDDPRTPQDDRGEYQRNEVSER